MTPNIQRSGPVNAEILEPACRSGKISRLVSFLRSKLTKTSACAFAGYLALSVSPAHADPPSKEQEMDIDSRLRMRTIGLDEFENFLLASEKKLESYPVDIHYGKPITEAVTEGKYDLIESGYSEIERDPERKKESKKMVRIPSYTEWSKNIELPNVSFDLDGSPWPHEWVEAYFQTDLDRPLGDQFFELFKQEYESFLDALKAAPDDADLRDRCTGEFVNRILYHFQVTLGAKPVAQNAHPLVGESDSFLLFNGMNQWLIPRGIFLEVKKGFMTMSLSKFQVKNVYPMDVNGTVLPIVELIDEQFIKRDESTWLNMMGKNSSVTLAKYHFCDAENCAFVSFMPQRIERSFNGLAEQLPRINPGATIKDFQKAILMHEGMHVAVALSGHKELEGPADINLPINSSIDFGKYRVENSVIAAGDWNESIADAFGLMHAGNAAPYIVGLSLERDFSLLQVLLAEEIFHSQGLNGQSMKKPVTILRKLLKFKGNIDETLDMAIEWKNNFETFKKYFFEASGGIPVEVQHEWGKRIAQFSAALSDRGPFNSEIDPLDLARKPGPAPVPPREKFAMLKDLWNRLVAQGRISTGDAETLIYRNVMEWSGVREDCQPRGAGNVYGSGNVITYRHAKKHAERIEKFGYLQAGKDERYANDICERLPWGLAPEWIADWKRTCGEKKVRIELLHLGQEASEFNVRNAAYLKGMRFATAEELLALGAAHPELQWQFPIIALGTQWSVKGRENNYAAALDKNGNQRMLNLGIKINDKKFGADTRFAVVFEDGCSKFPGTIVINSSTDSK